MLSAQQKPKLHLIAPHQNEHPAAVPFLKAMKKHLAEQGYEVSACKITNTHKQAWALRQRISEYPGFFEFGRDEITSLTNFATIALATQDVLTRASYVDSCLQACPGSLVIEVHSWMPDNAPGSGSPYEQDLGNGFILDDFRHVLHFALNQWRDDSLLGRLALMMRFDIDAARERIREITKRFSQQNAKVFCLEVPAEKTVRLIKSSDPLYPLYYKPDGTLFSGISRFEELYSIKAFCGAAYSPGDVPRIASIVTNLAD